MNTQTSSPIVVPQSVWAEQLMMPELLLTTLLALELALDALLELELVELAEPPPPSFSITTVPLHATTKVDETAPTSTKSRMRLMLRQRAASSR